MMLGGQLKVVILNKSYLNHDFILRVPHLHTGTIVIWQFHCSAIVSPHLSVEELIEFFVNISRRSEKGMAVMLAQSTSNCRVYLVVQVGCLILYNAE